MASQALELLTKVAWSGQQFQCNDSLMNTRNPPVSTMVNSGLAKVIGRQSLMQ